jgi:uncharacterized protein (TIGR00255 family)
MTGYGRGEAFNEGYRAVVELKAVNHRYNEINVRMPRELIAYEESLKKTITAHVRRGRIEAYITFERLTGSVPQIHVNLELAREIKAAGDGLAEQLSMQSDLSISQLLQFDGILNLQETVSDPEILQATLFAAAADAVNNLVQMRTNEGVQLRNDFVQRMRRLGGIVEAMQERAPEVSTAYRDKLRERMVQWLDGQVEVDESRLLSEVALLAERANIDEELVRLHSHLSQFADTLQLSEPVGRKLDFIVQEMNREINTIGSKANDLALSQFTLDAKSVLEQIREQVQNVE